MLAVFKYKNNEQLVREKRSKKQWKKSAKSFVCKKKCCKVFPSPDFLEYETKFSKSCA